MNYCLSKKLAFLLIEYGFTNLYWSNKKLEDDLCNTIYLLENEDWMDLRKNYREFIRILSSVHNEYVQYNFKDADDCINYLKYLPVNIAEEQFEREICKKIYEDDFH